MITVEASPGSHGGAGPQAQLVRLMAELVGAMAELVGTMAELVGTMAELIFTAELVPLVVMVGLDLRRSVDRSFTIGRLPCLLDGPCDRGNPRRRLGGGARTPTVAWTHPKKSGRYKS
jgi:hypothetical protein